MGVSGLLPLLKSIQRPTEIKKFKGEILGVDGYGWLHRAAYSCAAELGQGKHSQKWINAAMHRVRMLRHYGVTPYMVFDGDYLPSKAATEDSRAQKRDEKKKLAMELLKAGKTAQATQEFQKCIDVTPEMASTLIQQLKKMDIPYVVAPYEADAQLVYLERHGHIDGIISDDSDLLVFGAKRLLTKLDQYGNCIEINRRDFCACREVSLTGWTDADFRRMAIMSGCDYLDGLPGVGLKTAYRLLRNAKTPERAVRMVQFQGKRVSENYLTKFYQAELTFLHQWVFCPVKKELVNLTEVDDTRTTDEMPFIGSYVERALAQAVASGDVNPITKAAMSLPTTPSKRRHSQATPATSTEPPAKPIDSYFKGHQRIPMGEMDKNCFSVDPQRLAQITNEGSAPRVFPLPRPYVARPYTSTQSSTPRRGASVPTRTSPRLARRRTEPIGNLLSRVSSTPAPSKASPSSTSVTRNLSNSEPQRPPKKARLCEDDDFDKDLSPKQSKFFSAPPPKAKPTSSRDSVEIHLRSDDSIEEALLSLPDVDTWTPAPKPRKTINVFEEAKFEVQEDSGADGESQGRLSQHDDSSATALPPPKLAQSKSHTADTPLQPLQSSSQPSLNRFSFSSSSTFSATPASSASGRSSIFSAAATPSTAPSTAASRLTPLQRLGARAMDSTASPAKPSSRRRTSGMGFVAGLPVNPAFVPLPKVDLKEMESLNNPNGGGSEDQIIPDSDGENDDEAELAPKKLNLSRFAFN